MAIQVFHTGNQKVEDVVWSVDQNNDFLATFEDGTFLKFPAGATQEELLEQVAEHEVQNLGKQPITAEFLAEQAAINEKNEAVLAELNGPPVTTGV